MKVSLIPLWNISNCLGLELNLQSSIRKISNELAHNKNKKNDVRPPKTLIIAVWSVQSLPCTLWVAKEGSMPQAHTFFRRKVKTDETGRISKLFRVTWHMSYCWFCHVLFAEIAHAFTVNFLNIPTPKIAFNYPKILTMWLYHRVRSLNGKQCRPWSDCSDLGLHCLPRQAMSKDYVKIFNISQIWLNGIKVEFKTKENGIQIIKNHQGTKVTSVLRYEVDALYLSKIDSCCLPGLCIGLYTHLG